MGYRQTGRSTPANLVQSRITQVGPRSVSELESVLTLISQIHNILILNVWAGAYCFAFIWMIPCLGILLHCHLQDSGCGFQAVGYV